MVAIKEWVLEVALIVIKPIMLRKCGLKLLVVKGKATLCIQVQIMFFLSEIAFQIVALYSTKSFNRLILPHMT